MVRKNGQWFSVTNTGRWAGDFTKHQQRISEFIAYLRTRSELGISARQFEIYRLNYFCRTDMTVRTIARTAALAADCDDWQSLHCLAENLFDECGQGESEQNHRTLLEASHNLHASAVFNLSELKIADALRSKVLPATKAYRDSRRKAFFRSSYISALAASFAQEAVARPMLETFRNSLFVPYEQKYHNSNRSKLWKTIDCYFNVHLGSDGVEEKHGEMALACLNRRLEKSGRRAEETDEATTAIREFLDRQVALWDAMHSALKEAESEDEIVSVAERNSDTRRSRRRRPEVT